jgi:dienelactone hydrolase
VGLFVLDSPVGTFRDGNLRNRDFLAGYAWRYGWSLMEPARDSYDFAALDHILARVAERHQKLSWIVMPTPGVSAEPAYVLAQAGTWTDAGGSLHALPWDSFTLSRYQSFMNALQAHRVADPAQNGALVPLGDHSAFYAINVTFPGVPNLALRDSHDALVDIPGYTRAALQDAVVATLRAVRTAFPKQRVHFGFWKYQNDSGSDQAWQSMQSRINSEFGGTVGVFEDNLAAARPCPACDPYTATPTVDFAAPLVAAKSTTYTAFQALASWTNPGTVDPAKVMNGTPMDGIDYALQNFGSRYVELYVDDVDRSDWQPGLRAAATRLAQDGHTNCAALQVSGDATADNGATWSYSSTDDGVTYSLTGTLFMPAGAGPFPGVVISHGAGGNASGYSASIARTMRGWGMVAIATNYTHAGGLSGPTLLPAGGDGASEANVQRAHKTRNLLGCVPAVNMQRLAAHGHSMGAFVTGQLLGTYPQDFRAASHTAGGASDNGPNATRAAVAAQIRTPYQIHHGDADTVVSLALDQELDRILTTNTVAHELKVYPGFTHEQMALDAVMLERVRAWYTLQGVL